MLFTNDIILIDKMKARIILWREALECKDFN